MKKNKPKKTIEPILDNSSGGKFKRLPKKSSPGGYFMISVHDVLEVKYVHQLQNLYFALTNQELHTNETSK